ncbi:MAG: glycosyltransferase family 2 protein [Burkholderiaceae bacterium]
MQSSFAAARRLQPCISCVLPAFNEAANLPALLERLIRVLAELTPRWEVLVVDDGSTDTTPAAMLGWVHRPGVRYLRLSRNFGKEAALTAGIDRAEGDVVILMDADGQHPPELIASMLHAWSEGIDMVCTARDSRADESFVKRLGTRLFYRLVNASSAVPIPPDVGDFRLMDRCVVDALKSLPERNRFMKGLYAWVGFSTRVITYMPQPRAVGSSRFSLRGLTRLGLTGITAFSNTPLRVCSAAGALTALVALGLGVWIVFEHYFIGHPVPGWATLVASGAFFSGMQLLSIGILGEYVGRIFDEVKSRPVYLIAHEAGRGALDGEERDAGEGEPRGVVRTIQRAGA